MTNNYRCTYITSCSEAGPEASLCWIRVVCIYGTKWNSRYVSAYYAPRTRNPYHFLWMLWYIKKNCILWYSLDCASHLTLYNSTSDESNVFQNWYTSNSLRSTVYQPELLHANTKEFRAGATQFCSWHRASFNDGELNVAHITGHPICRRILSSNTKRSDMHMYKYKSNTGL